MPRIRADNLAGHYDVVWTSIMEALESLLSERAFTDIKFADIGNVAGVARNTLYNYAKDRNDLLDQAAAVASKDLLATLAGRFDDAARPAEQLKLFIGGILEWVSTGPYRHTVFANLSQSRVNGASPRQIENSVELKISEQITKVVERGRAEGDFRSDLNTDIMVTLMSGAMKSAVDAAMTNPARLPTIRKETTAFILTAISN